MARHFSSLKHSSLPGMAWRRLGMVVLLGMVLLLFSIAAVAHVPFSTPSTASGHTGVEPLPDATMPAVFVDVVYPAGPHCHHDHGTHHADSALLRQERLDLEFEPCSLNVTTPAMAPQIVVVSGTPSALPVLSSVPVYLLSQRFRV